LSINGCIFARSLLFQTTRAGPHSSAKIKEKKQSKMHLTKKPQWKKPSTAKPVNKFVSMNANVVDYLRNSI
jgi:hypothetical protein